MVGEPVDEQRAVDDLVAPRLHVEERRDAPVRDGVDAFLLVGSRASCEEAAQQAAQQSLQKLNGHKRECKV